MSVELGGDGNAYDEMSNVLCLPIHSHVEQDIHHEIHPALHDEDGLVPRLPFSGHICTKIYANLCFIHDGHIVERKKMDGPVSSHRTEITVSFENFFGLECMSLSACDSP